MRTARIIGIRVGLCLLAIQPLIYGFGLQDPAGLPRFFIQALAAVCLFASLPKSRFSGILNTGPGLILSATLIWSALSVFWAGSKGLAVLGLIHLLQNILNLFLGYQVSRIPTFSLNLLKGFILAGVCVAGLGYCQALELTIPGLEQAFAPASTFVNRNVAAQFCAFMLVGLTSWLISTKNTKELFFLVPGIALVSVYFVLTEARASWLALAVVGAIWFFRNRGRGEGAKPGNQSLAFKRFLLPMAIVLLLFPIPLQRLPEFFKGQVSTLIEREGTELNTGFVRVALYLNSLQMIMDRPFCGWGLNQFKTAYSNYHKAWVQTPTYSISVRPEHLHNDWLQSFVETGVIGGVGFISAVLALVIGLHRSRKGETNWVRSSFFYGFLVICIIGIFDFPLKTPIGSGLFWLSIGLFLGWLKKPKGHATMPEITIALTLSIFLVGALCVALAANRMHRLADKELALGNLNGAVECLKRSIRLNPLDWKPLDDLVSLECREPGTWPQAEKDADSLLKLFPDQPNAHYRLGFLLVQKGEWLNAREHLNLALDKGGPSADALCLFALCAWRLGERGSAKEALIAAIQLQPDAPGPKKLWVEWFSPMAVPK